MTRPVTAWAAKSPEGVIQTSWVRASDDDAWDAIVCWHDDEMDDDFWNPGQNAIDQLRAGGWRVVPVEIREIEK